MGAELRGVRCVFAIDDERDAVLRAGDCNVQVRPRFELTQILANQLLHDCLWREDEDPLARFSDLP
jgi:hypothetical protein